MTSCFLRCTSWPRIAGLIVSSVHSAIYAVSLQCASVPRDARRLRLDSGNELQSPSHTNDGIEDKNAKNSISNNAHTLPH